MNAAYQGPPRSIWEVNQQLQFDEALAPDDPRWVDTAEARGEFSFDRLYRTLAWIPAPTSSKAHRRGRTSSSAGTVGAARAPSCGGCMRA